MIDILIIEDDKSIQNFFKVALRTHGYACSIAPNGLSGISVFHSERPSLVILDLGLPDIDGAEVLKQIRDASEVPVIIVSARGEEGEKVKALDMGADDYITKPFHFDELLSRINALTRRSQINKINSEPNNKIELGDLMIDLDQYKVSVNNQEIDLSPREYKLLIYLIENREKTVTRVQILNAVWGITFDNHTNVVDVYISYLRNKIEKNNKYIHTIKGVGYLFKV